MLKTILPESTLETCESRHIGTRSDMPTFGVSKEGDKILELCKEISCILKQP